MQICIIRMFCLLLPTDMHTVMCSVHERMVCAHSVHAYTDARSHATAFPDNTTRVHEYMPAYLHMHTRKRRYTPYVYMHAYLHIFTFACMHASHNILAAVYEYNKLAAMYEYCASVSCTVYIVCMHDMGAYARAIVRAHARTQSARSRHTRQPNRQ